MNDADDAFDRPRTKKKKRKQEDKEDRIASYGMGVFLLLLGMGMLVWYYYTQRAPSRLFNLLAAGGIACVLSAVGLFLHPLDQERLRAFQNEPNPIAVFKIMPPFWKVWLLVIAAAMAGAFVYVAQTTVRVR